MSYYDFRASLDLTVTDPPFAALIMAAMRKADSSNANTLRAAFPEIWAEFFARYHSRGQLASDGSLARPAGLLPEERWHGEPAPEVEA